MYVMVGVSVKENVEHGFYTRVTTFHVKKGARTSCGDLGEVV